MFSTPLSTIKGVGEKKAKLLLKLQLYSLRDMLFFLPRDYQDFSVVTPCAALEEGISCVLVRFSAEARVAYVRKGLSIVSVQAHDETGSIRVVWYNQPFRKKQICAGQSAMVYGKVRINGRQKTFENPEIETIDDLGKDIQSSHGIMPVYSLTAGVGQKTMRTIVQACLKQCIGHIQETLPEGLRKQFGLCEINFAIEQVHYPSNKENLAIARKRLASEELFFFLLAVGCMEQLRKKKTGIKLAITDEQMQGFLSMLPFQLTIAQEQAIQEIRDDMAKALPMNRLVQGDVGSGKTVLALFALYVAVQNGFQGVLLAPTEILARQHVTTAQKIFGDLFSIEMLIGAMTAKQKRETYERIATHQSQIIIGTHAVLQENIFFANLGVVITDEQHRFGVKQRATLSKNSEVDILVMSATPIPRTLTLILYGDLDVTILKGLPPGRKPISTHYVSPKKRNDLYQYVFDEAMKGNQSYIVCPLVEESEKLLVQSATQLYQELQKTALNEVGIALVHGKMPAKDKEEIIQSFRKGEIKVLIATTVIEVGVDVPQSTIMIVEDADRFGLAQLHQLRGRVGRGDTQSYCFLLSKAQGEEAQQRIKTMCESSDGFVIAQKDLELRGPGEFLGTRQSGIGDFKMARLASDLEVFQLAQKMARFVLSKSFDDKERKKLIVYTQEKYMEKFREIAFN